jgi:hypothetical protein
MVLAIFQASQQHHRGENKNITKHFHVAILTAPKKETIRTLPEPTAIQPRMVVSLTLASRILAA